MFGKEIWFHGRRGSMMVFPDNHIVQSYAPDQDVFRRRGVLKRGLLRSSRRLDFNLDV